MSDLASQFEKTMMAHAFLECVDRLLAMAHASLAKDPHLAVTAIFQMWLQWFKTVGSGVEWPELATVEKECRQLYKQYKGEEWVCPFDVHFAPVDPSLEFLMDDLTAGMTVSAPAVASTSNTTKHLVGVLAVARGEGWSEGCGDDEAANRGDIQEVGPSTPKAAAGGIARGLVTSPRLATTLRSKEKGKGKAREEEDKDIEDHIEETFTDKRLATLLCCATTAGPIMTQRAAGTPLGSSPVIAATEGAVVGGGGGAKVKSREVVESDEDDNDSNGDVPLAWKQAASPALIASAKRPQTVTSKEGEGDVEMRETTLLATVAEVEWEASNMEVKGEEELEAVPAVAEEDKEEERAEEAKVRRRGTWSDMPLHQVSDDKLEWLGKDLGWPTLLTSVVSLVDFDKRAAGVEWRFQRELEAAKEELLAAQACYTVAKRTLATLAGYQRNCQAFLAWQEENNIGKGDWEEAGAMEVPDDNADLDA
ncbi:hypothetical protein J132_08874 [Termitomyces sp. J132]|nr:hypothetical protein J132_08874 [Termitomyces sp. J132]